MGDRRREEREIQLNEGMSLAMLLIRSISSLHIFSDTAVGKLVNNTLSTLVSCSVEHGCVYSPEIVRNDAQTTCPRHMIFNSNDYCLLLLLPFDVRA